MNVKIIGESKYVLKKYMNIYKIEIYETKKKLPPPNYSSKVLIFYLSLTVLAEETISFWSTFHSLIKLGIKVEEYWLTKQKDLCNGLYGELFFASLKLPSVIPSF